MKIKQIYDKNQYKHEKGSTKSKYKVEEYSEIDLLERALFGISNKEIKDVNKQIGKYPKSMPAHAFEIQQAHKFSAAQVIKDEKTLIAKWKKEIPLIKERRVAEKKRLKELMAKGGVDGEGESEGEEEKGEDDMEGEMEGEMDGDMEGVEA